MIESMSAADVDNADRFERLGIAADGLGAAQIREEFAQWLERFFDLDPIRASDLLLATNEALANAAEFAYHLAEHPGTIDVRAWFDATDSRLTVTITDQGTWREKTPATTKLSRGRGIPLMEALTDRATIQKSSTGTQVRLEWSGVLIRSNTTGSPTPS